jgi:GNAT superfamily N-acetyltransferase
MNPIKIVNYTAEHQPWFEKFNREWIEKYFWLEDIDRFVLSHPEDAILYHGGAILMGLYNNEIAGTVALMKVSDEVYELAKLAVGEQYRRKGIADALCKAAIYKAKELGATKIILYSQTVLRPALLLYNKLGFKEVPIELGIYERADVKMELNNVQTWQFSSNNTYRINKLELS